MNFCQIPLPSPSIGGRNVVAASGGLSLGRRWFCLAICSFLAIAQLLFLHRRLLPLLPFLSTTPGAILPFSKASGGGPSQIGHQQQRLPSFLIIGVRKGGTRALLDALSLHPRVRVARHEVHFFDNDEHYRLGADWYRAQMPMAGPDEVVIEKTPAYFTANPKVPKRVYALNPGMKLILIVREPVTRTVSDFTQIQQTKRERRKPALDFERMSFVHGQNGSVELNRRFKPIRNSLYAEHLDRWLQYFPLGQFLVLDGDKFIRDPLCQLRIAEHFLGLEAAIQPDQLVFSKDKGFFCFRSERNTTAAHCLGQSKGRKQVNISAAHGRLLAQHFAPHNRQFFALLNRQFHDWKQPNNQLQ